MICRRRVSRRKIPYDEVNRASLIEFLKREKEKEICMNFKNPEWITKYGMDWTILKQIEAKGILEVMRACSWNRCQASEILGVTKGTLQSKLEDYQRRGMLVGQSSPGNFRKVISEDFWNELKVLCEV